MPGIYGFAKAGGLTSTSLSGVANAMRLYDHFAQDELFEDDSLAASRAHLGAIAQKSSPAVLDNVRVWVEGEAYNHRNVADSLKLQKSSFADLLLEAYVKSKLDVFLNRIDGYFCAALYDADRQQVKLISDRYGMRMLYWYAKNGSFAWGSEVKAILACEGVDKTIDPTSYECFMDLGYLLGEHTWFEKIKLIKPATALTYDLKTQQIEQHYYWTWAEIKPSQFTFDEAVEELGKRFITAVERRFDPSENVGVALSGGLDSRAIFAAANYLYPDSEGYAYTFGIPNCDDITIAKQVISRSNWTHESFHFNDKNWFQPRLEKVWNTDGMLDMMHMHGGEFIKEIAAKMDINLNGYSGDAIFGGGFLTRVPLNTRITKENSRAFYKNFAGLANIDDVLYEIERVEPNLQMNRVRRFTAMGTVNGLIAVEQRKPFFDNACVELIFSIPDEYRLNNKLYSMMLQKVFPKYFKDIPWQKTGKPAGVVDPPSMPKRAVNKVMRQLEAAIGIKSSKGYTNYKAWIRSPGIAEYLMRLLDPSTAIYPTITKQDCLTGYLKPHLDNPMLDKSNQILRAATIEIYLRKVNGKDMPN